MSMTLRIAGLRVSVEVGIAGQTESRGAAEASHRQNLAHQAAEIDRERWITGLSA